MDNELLAELQELYEEPFASTGEHDEFGEVYRGLETGNEYYALPTADILTAAVYAMMGDIGNFDADELEALTGLPPKFFDLLFPPAQHDAVAKYDLIEAATGNADEALRQYLNAMPELAYEYIGGEWAATFAGGADEVDGMSLIRLN